MPQAPTVPQQLADMAGSLAAMIEAGAFDLCFEHTRHDMASLAAKLSELADQAEAQVVTSDPTGEQNGQ